MICPKMDFLEFTSLTKINWRYNKMKKMFFMAFFAALIAGCDDNNWKPDYIAFANVKEIQLSGLTGKPGIEFNIGYWKTNNYNTKKMFKKYTLDGTDHFSPGIDISYIAFEKYYSRLI
jgi:hypothetical protein